nr:trypsin-like peptidase domain-containing protein [Gemmobacter serpentinus]
MRRLPLLFGLALVALLGGVAGLRADDAGLKSLETSDMGRGWDAVGRLNLGTKGFCTGALIAPDLVLTAGHCLFDRETGARIDPAQIEFLAGWRNGRAVAYRGVRRALAHPDYVYGGGDSIARVPNDVALLQLDQAIRLPSVTPFATANQPQRGDQVGIVSYARDRSEAPSLQEVCEVLAQRDDMLMLTCDVDFGSSGAPVFALAGGVARVVSVVSAKAEVEGRKVALGTALEGPLADLKAELLRAEGAPRPGKPRVLRGGSGSAKFVRPGE